jgi:hypothetical protein
VFIVHLIYISGIESVHVTVTDSDGKGCTRPSNGTIIGTQYICGDLFSAMNISCQQSYLVIYINTSFISIHQAFPLLHAHKFNLQSNCHVSWVGSTSNCTIKCSPGESLAFSGKGTYSISFSSLIFDSCGGYDPGITIRGLTSVFFNQISFKSSTVSLLNIPQIDIRNSRFIESYITPNAALQLLYNEPVVQYDPFNIIVNITGSYFKDNSGGASACNNLECLPGILALSVSKMEISNISFNMDFCMITNNHMSADFPMMNFKEVNSSTIKVTIANCHFKYNYYSWSIETQIDGNNIEMNLFNNTFSQNTDSTSKGLLHIATYSDKLVGNESLYFSYNQTNFYNNQGTVIVITSCGSAFHVFDGNILSDNIASKNLISIDGQGNSTVFMKNTNITNNIIQEITYSNIGVAKSSVMYLTNITLLNYNISFQGAKSNLLPVTMVTLSSVNATFIGYNTFEYNHGVYGGAMFIEGETNIKVADNSSLYFDSNYADYGGALYINSSTFINSLNKSGLCDKERLHFHNNHARVAGSNIYIVTINDNDFYYQNLSCEVFFDRSILAPTNLISNDKNISLFSGQTIRLNVSVTDIFHKQSACQAELLLVCDYQSESLCEVTHSNIKLYGAPLMFLNGTDKKINTQLKFINTDNSNITVTVEPKLRLTCVDPPLPTKVFIDILIVECPSGFTYDNDTKQCECNSNPDVKCLTEYGISCVKKHMWVNSTNTNETIKCPPSLCNISFDNVNTTYCIAQYGAEMVALPPTEDDQCLDHRSGIRCSTCQDNFYFTFGGVSCTSTCDPFHIIFIYVFAVSIQLFIMILLLVVLRLKLKIGSGFLYGPLLFIAVVGHMHFDYYMQTSVLKTIVNIVQSLFLMNLEILGNIPWCFAKVTSTMISFSLYYLGPILVWIFLFIIVIVGRCCPRVLYKIQKSPVQALCLLMMLSFWSIASTSVQLLVPVKFGEGYRSYVDPQMTYFRGWHILFGLLAIASIVIIIIPFIGILSISNITFLSHFLRLYRFKPIFDEFQSCYRDQCRWYCVVYYITWIIYLMIADYLIATQILFVLILSLHFLLEPYKYRLQNVIDMFLLLDLIFINFLLSQMDKNDESTIFQQVLIYIMILLPLALILIGCVITIVRGMVKECYTMKIRKATKLIKYENNEPTYSSVHVSVTNVGVAGDDEREPIIGILQDQDNNY